MSTQSTNQKIQFKVISTEYDFQILSIVISGNGIIEPRDLESLKLPSPIDFTKGVIISGKAPVWLFSYLSHELHIATWVATYDPRLGGIVTQTHASNSYKVGSIVKNEMILEYLSGDEGKIPDKKQSEKINKTIVVAGPPHSGKSVFINLLSMKIRSLIGQERFQREFFIIRACPDGEGNWTTDVPEDVTKIIRMKRKFDDEFVKQVIQDIRNAKISKEILIIDCGGKIDKKNQMIFNECTHAIIVSGKSDEIDQWKGAIKTSELKIIAEISSTLENKCEAIGDNKYEIGRFERGVNDITIPFELIDSMLK